MSRTKEFDVDSALERAMDLFWDLGYEATSPQELLDHMGIGRQSLYDTFGDKHRLYLAALDRYSDTVSLDLLGDLAHPDASVEALRRFFGKLVKGLVSDKDRRACFLLNSTTEMATHDPEVARRVRAHILRLEAVFLNAIRNAMAREEVVGVKDAAALARHLTATMQGLAVMAKAGVSPVYLRDAASSALSFLA